MQATEVFTDLYWRAAENSGSAELGLGRTGHKSEQTDRNHKLRMNTSDTQQQAVHCVSVYACVIVVNHLINLLSSSYLL